MFSWKKRSGWTDLFLWQPILIPLFVSAIIYPVDFSISCPMHADNPVIEIRENKMYNTNSAIYLFSSVLFPQGSPFSW